MAVVDIVLNCTLATIMFGLGLSITRTDLRNLFRDPKSVIIGLAGQMILLPIVAWMLAQASNLSVEFKMGFLILSICPGGVTSNLVSYFLRANVALGISLTIINAIISVFTIPLLIIFFAGHLGLTQQGVEINFLRTLIEIFLITLLPAFLGWLFRRKYSKQGFIINKYLNWILPLLLLLVFGVKFLGNSAVGGSGLSSQDIIALAPWVIILNIISMVAGFTLGKTSGLNNRNTLTCTIEIGLHNTALALIIAGSQLHNTAMEKPALVYALFSVIVTLLVGYGLSKLFPFKTPSEV